MSTVVSHASKCKFGGRRKRTGSFGYYDIISLHQVGADVGGGGDGEFIVVVVVDLLIGSVPRAEADDDDMDVGFSPRLAHPGKGAVGEMDFNGVALEKVIPKDADLLALRDGVCGDEGDGDVSGRVGILPAGFRILRNLLSRMGSVVPAIGSSSRRDARTGGRDAHPTREYCRVPRDVACRFQIPGGDVIEDARAFDLTPDVGHVGFLLKILLFFADEGRVAEDERALGSGEHVVPIHAQGVAVDDVRGGGEGQSVVKLEEEFAGLGVHLVVHQPEGDFGDAHRPFANLDAVELIDIDGGKNGLVANGKKLAEGGGLEGAEFAVGEDEEVAATTGGIEKLEGADAFQKAFDARATPGGAVGEESLQVGLEFVEKEGADDFHNVAFAGVMGALLTPGAVFHNALEEGAKDGGRDAAPLEFAAVEERIAHGPGENGGAEAFGKKASVYIGKGGEDIVEVLGAVGGCGIEDFKEILKLRAKVGAIGAGLAADKGGEGFRLEDAVILGKKAEQEANEEAFEFVTREAARFELVVELAHAGVGFFVGLVLRLVTHPRLSEHEGEMADVFRKIGQHEMVTLHFPACEEGQVGLVVGLQIVEDEGAEIGDEDVTGNLVPPIFAGEVFDVGEGLGGSGGEVFAPAFVFDDEAAFPKEVDGGGVALEVADVFLERGEGGAAEAEDVEEIVPESLLMRTLGEGAGVFGVAGKA